MKFQMIALATATSAVAAAVSKESRCPEIVQIIGQPVYELQLDGSYRNNLDSTITQNSEDRVWFFMGKEGENPIVSFDGADCPTDNKKWYQLDLSVMEYTEFNLSFL